MVVKTNWTGAQMIAAASCGLLWVGVSAPAAAATSQTAVKSSQDDATNRRAVRVCRRLQPTGSRLAERVCRSQGEWDELAQATRNGKETSEREDTVGHNPTLNGTNPLDRRGNPQ